MWSLQDQNGGCKNPLTVPKTSLNKRLVNIKQRGKKSSSEELACIFKDAKILLGLLRNTYLCYPFKAYILERVK